jgi:membrane-bound metal-dependent hydrolase YbcI (DUF457 family)
MAPECILSVMDPLTHYMWAYHLGNKIKLDKTHMRALTFGALLPDIDIFTFVFGLEFVRDFHGTITHSIIGAILLSIILGMIFLVFYRKIVFHLCLIGISMHLLLDLSMTLMPRWRDDGMILFYPISPEKIALRNYIPNSTILGIILMGFLFVAAVFLLSHYVIKKEYPWRTWIDERRIIHFLKRN